MPRDNGRAHRESAVTVGIPQRSTLAAPSSVLGRSPDTRSRLTARAKFLYDAGTKFYVRGVTYGTFRSGGRWNGLPDSATLARDFALMAASGINTVRVYDSPPRRLLDLAAAHGLRVIVGLAWEQHVAFLDERDRPRSIEQRVRAAVRRCAGHPAVLCYAVGNEIPAPIVRWHGPTRVSAFLERLWRAVKDEDPDALVTYANYPSTEYLELPFLDLVCFNVFLEDPERLAAYISRLHTVAGDRPVILTELGLDSRRHGEVRQALAAAAQVRTAFAGGCAGGVVFSWTDEWHRGGHDIDDWDFGLVRRDRTPKPALALIRRAFAEVPFPAHSEWPSVSVIVCAHDAEDTLAWCLDGVAELDYPNYEAIVVDDGSTDATAEIARRFGVRVVQVENGGLSAARNTGLAEATGEIAAYLDADARPDPHWLSYLAATFVSTAHAGIGGPNVPPPEEGPVARCVARAPGGPIHVLVSDREAEHIPGCNMAFRRAALAEAGGFDPQFRQAGDDVDICWRLRGAGWTLGFEPAAVVWHRRRPSVRAFWRQQVGYGKAEALLERKWPEKYNRVGNPTWQGRLYGGSAKPRRGRWRVYYGTWGTGLFQSVYERTPGTLSSIPLMPEWYLVVFALAALAGYELAVEPLLVATPGLDVPISLLLLGAAVFALLARPGHEALTVLRNVSSPPPDRLRTAALTAVLYVLQPLARLWGRLSEGLTPWRRRPLAFAPPRPRRGTIWSEEWRSTEERLEEVERQLRGDATGLVRGSPFDRWDLHVRPGPVGGARLRLAVEEHGAGRQLVRFHVWPRPSRGGSALALALAAFAVASGQRGAVVGAALLGAIAFLLASKIVRECGAGVAACLRALPRGAEAASGALADDLMQSLREEHPPLPAAASEPVRLP